MCKVLKGGAIFYRHNPRRERTVKVLSRVGCRWGQVVTAEIPRTKKYMDCRQGVPQGDRKEASSRTSSTWDSP